ncbi:MAG: glycosyltransferase family 4 protein [Candidatus Doudnabacteria bacterium]
MRCQNGGKNILILTPCFSPNVGGVETHLDDLCDYLDANSFKVYVLTYQPLTNRTTGPPHEKRGEVEIYRFRWPGFNLFHLLENHKILLFLYITPYLLLRSFLFMLKNRKRIDIIHSHGLNAAFIGYILKKIFKDKKLITSTHSIYNFSPRSFFARLLQKVFAAHNLILAQSQDSKKELETIGVNPSKIQIFVHWVNLKRFQPLNQNAARQKLNWPLHKFTVIFIGRLIYLKGADLIIKLAKRLQKINFFIVGDEGPLLPQIKNAKKKLKNFNFVCNIPYNQLSWYYNAADIFCYPARYHEDMSRAINEALACGTPIIVTNRGAKPYTLNKNFAFIVKTKEKALADKINLAYKNPLLLQQMAQKGLKHVNKLSDASARLILKAYQNLYHNIS